MSLFPRSRRSHRSRRARPMSSILLVSLFAVMLLGSVGDQIAMARQADLAQATEQPEQPEATEAPLETPEPEATEEVVIEATEEPENEMLGAIEVDYWECPVGYDIANPNLENLYQDCAGQNGVPFTATTSDGQTRSQSTGEYGDAHVSFTELPTGVTIVAGGTGGPGMAWCNGIVQHGGPETGYMPLDVGSGSFGWELQDDEIVFCSWITVTSAEPADLLVHLFACPPGYDEQADGADPTTDCTEPVDGVTYRLTDNDPETSDLQTDTGDSIPGTVMFGGMPANAYTLTQTVPDGMARTFLWDCTVDGAAISDPASLPLNDGPTWNLVLAGQNLDCAWFMVPLADNGTPEPTSEPGNELLGAFEIEYRECAADYAFLPGTDEDSLEQMYMDCAPIDGVEFTIDQGGPDGPSQVTADSHASFVEVPTGDRTVTQVIPAEVAYVVCEGIVSNGGPETGPIVMTVTSGVMTWNLLDEEVVYCSWFVQGPPAGDRATNDTGSIQLTYRSCPENYAFLDATVDSQLEVMLNDCAPEDNIQFTIDQAGTNGGTQVTEDAQLSFDGVPVGMRSLRQESPWGDANTYVVCEGIVSNGGPETGPLELPATSGSVQWNLQAGEVVYCHWFVGDGVGRETPVPATTGDITIRYHECPTGTDFATLPEAELPTTCNGTVNGIAFSVVSGGQYNGIGATGDNGTGEVTFQAVEPGLVYVKQLTPLSQLIVICSGATNGGNPSTPMRMPVTQATIEWLLEAGQLTTCDWYAIPEPAGEGSMAVLPFLCPKGSDPAAISADTAATVCTGETPDMKVILRNGTQVIESELRKNGLEFQAHPSGQVTVQVVAPEGFQLGAVRCRSIDMGDRSTEIIPWHGVPFTTDNIIDRPMVAGLLTECSWYLVPPDATEGDNSRLELAVYTCDINRLPNATPSYDDLIGACAPETDDVPFYVTNADGFTKSRTITGSGIIENIPPSYLTISPELPDGRPLAFVRCSERAIDTPATGLSWSNQSPDDDAIYYQVAAQKHVTCAWFTVIMTPEAYLTIDITTLMCPEGTMPGQSRQAYESACTQPHAGVNYRVTHPGGMSTGTTDGNGRVSFANVSFGLVGIQQYIPLGYGEPVVSCTLSATGNPRVIIAGPFTLEAVGGLAQTDPVSDGQPLTLTCQWYSLPAGQNSLTITAHACPAWYDPTAPHANPAQECTEGLNGVTFTLQDDDDQTNDMQSDTGDAIPYTVQFGSLPIGDYTVSGDIPDGYTGAFYWNCTGQRSGEQRPSPVINGTTLDISLRGDEHVTCSWYAIAEATTGALTVVSYDCATPTFVSAVDCQVHETGREFDLAWWNGATWDIVASGTTDGQGRVRFDELEAGEYWVVPTDGDACHLSSDALSDNGEWIDVAAGEEAIVSVYSCGAEPGKPGKTPTKYPNTGIPGQRWEDALAA